MPERGERARPSRHSSQYIAKTERNEIYLPTFPQFTVPVAEKDAHSGKWNVCAIRRHGSMCHQTTVYCLNQDGRSHSQMSPRMLETTRH